MRVVCKALMIAAVGVAAVLGVGLAADAAPPAAATTEGPDAASKKIQEQIDKGIAYLKSKQAPDGVWHVDKDPPGITALVLKGLVQSGKLSTKDEFVRKGYEKMLASQQADGGVYTDAIANYNTALAVSALAAANDPSFKEQTDRAIKFLHRMQWTPDTPASADGKTVKTTADPWYGGFTYAGKGRPDLSNTAFTLAALKDAGLKPDDPAYKAAVTFLSRCQNLSETNDQKFAGDDGGAIYTPANGEGASAAGGAPGPDGVKRWNSYGAMSYAFVESMLYAGVKKDDPRLVAAHKWIGKNWTVDEHPGMRLSANGKPESGLYYYYVVMARAMHAWGDPIVVDAKGTKHDWRLELSAKLATLQQADGSWVGDKRWRETNPVLVTAYAVLVLEEIQQDLKDHPAAK